MSLEFTESQLDEMVAHVQDGLPNEACGLLGGLDGRVHKVYAVTNAAQSPVSYTMDPLEQVRAMVAIEEAGWELLGIFHSHPQGPPAPSATDLAKAYYPDAAYIILSPDARGGWQARGFNMVEGQVSEIAVRVRPDLSQHGQPATTYLRGRAWDTYSAS